VAFDKYKYDIEKWLVMEDDNLLQKVCKVIDTEGRLIGEYKTRVTIVPVGVVIPYGSSKGRPKKNQSPSLYRSFSYDDDGNQIASLPEIREWTQACEDAAQGANPDPDDPVDIPLGVQVVGINYTRADVSSVPIESTVTVLTKTLASGEAIYLRHCLFSGCWPAAFQVFVDGQQIGTTKYLTWLKYDNEMLFDTANGGILYKNEETIEVKVKNYGEDLGDFESSIGFVTKVLP
jgi:hypothetical protein